MHIRQVRINCLKDGSSQSKMSLCSCEPPSLSLVSRLSPSLLVFPAKSPSVSQVGERKINLCFRSRCLDPGRDMSRDGPSCDARLEWETTKKIE